MGILIARDAMLLIIAGLIVHEMWHPELDVVRTDGSDDPGGGCFDHAPDFYAADRRPIRALRTSQMSHLAD
jgi:hypothetical protein